MKTARTVPIRLVTQNRGLQKNLGAATTLLVAPFVCPTFCVFLKSFFSVFRNPRQKRRTKKRKTPPRID
jgi:hypothetical protein